MENILETMARDQNRVMPGQSKHIQVFFSYSHDSEDHKTRVKVLSDRLSQNGINCILDQYLDNDGPEVGWASWSEKKILGADYIFIVCTEGYYRRIQGLEKAVGRGAEWEFDLILKLIYKDKSQYDRLIPVLFSKDDEKFIPERLNDLPHYCLDNEAEYEKLHGRIKGPKKNNSPYAEFNCWEKAQNEWLLTQFGSENLSRASFQQKIQVHGEGHTFIERKSALEELNKWLSQWGMKNNIFVLSGEEGDGKTWAVASWITEYIKHINKIPIVFLPARDLSSPAIEKILIESISTRQKTRDVNFGEKKINDWKDRPYSNAPIVILVIDGINENFSFEWQWLIEQIQAEPWEKRIAVILTSRTKYWQDRFSQQEHLKTIQNWILPPYNDVELNEALARYNLTISDLPHELHDLIRKPRYMNLVVKYRDEMAGSEDITVQRLIYEDFKDRVGRIRNQHLTNDNMVNIITGLAEKASNGKGLFTLKDFSELIPFVEKKEAIFEELKTGRIFITDDLRGEKFRVESKRLAHGLGIILLDHLRNLSPLNSVSIEEGIACFLEPQREMDFKVEIVAAAVFHIMNGLDLPEVIRYELLKYWIRSVNFPGDHLDDFPAYFPCSPQTYFNLAENTLKLDRYDDMARRLLQYTFIKWAKKDKFQELFKKKFEEWMGYLNICGIEKIGGG
ncbi:MAG TPA: SEFIR domain-containing protein, partial [Candidatus Kapabacteria bacterium]|nr:SEFIR domain-containing protein [Candidatus Kapabacteria bacterium]